MSDSITATTIPGLLTVVLTPEQAGMVVVGLLELAKNVPTAQQMDLSRLAIGINDLIVGVEDGATEPG